MTMNLSQLIQCREYYSNSTDPSIQAQLPLLDKEIAKQQQLKLQQLSIMSPEERATSKFLDDYPELAGQVNFLESGDVFSSQKNKLITTYPIEKDIPQDTESPNSKKNNMILSTIKKDVILNVLGGADINEDGKVSKSELEGLSERLEIADLISFDDSVKEHMAAEKFLSLQFDKLKNKDDGQISITEAKNTIKEINAPAPEPTIEVWDPSNNPIPMPMDLESMSTAKLKEKLRILDYQAQAAAENNPELAAQYKQLADDIRAELKSREEETSNKPKPQINIIDMIKNVLINKIQSMIIPMFFGR